MTGRFDFERAILRSDLPPLSRFVALTLATWADDATGTIPHKFTPSLTRLAEATAISRSSVRNHLNRLELAGWVIRKRPDVELARSQGARTEYQLVVPPRAGGALPEQTPRAPAALAVGQETTTGRAPVALIPTKNSNPSSNQRSADPADTIQEVADAMTREFRVQVDQRHAGRIVQQVLAGKDVSDPFKYVMAAVRRNPEPYLPTYTPPRYRAPDRALADGGGGGPPRAAPTAETASKAPRGLRV